MLTVEKKLMILELMQRMADEMLPNGYEKDVKQNHIEDDKWHQSITIKLYDSDEWYNNIEPKYEVYCSKDYDKDEPYGLIILYDVQKNYKEITRMTVAEAQMMYNN